jgi:uncharacterized ferritin-like protein (DUF455 family)
MLQTPPQDTVERWLWDYIATTDLAHKLAPPPVPARWETRPPARRIGQPGRPAQLRPARKARKFPGPGALQHVLGRARIVHTFVHHELQAAELMAWAILAFPETPRPFRRGLLAICREEMRHMRLYAGYLQTCGVAYGDFTVRDWFWDRVPAATTAAHFVAVMGVGFEGGNLDHSERFARLFRDAGDVAGAGIVATVGSEEIRHVRFAAHWFRRFTGGLDFDAWRAHLPAPLSPIVMRGDEMNTLDRARAGLDGEFLARLAASS